MTEGAQQKGAIGDRVARVFWRKEAGSILLLATLFWVARYWKSAEFGLYEDDLTIVPDAIGMSLRELAQFIVNYIVNLHGHARPLSNSLIYLFSNLGWRISGFTGLYLAGFLIETANVALFYALVRRVWGGRLALLGGLAYVLFSADTTQAFLTHSLGAQPSITLLLLALHAYLSNRRVLAYALAFPILFSYETPFPVFMAAPLLERTDRRTLSRRLAIHAAILAGMLAVAYSVRAWVGEERVTDQPISTLLLSSMTHMAVGPIVSVGTYVYRPVQALATGSSSVLAVAAIGALVFAAVLTRSERAEVAPGPSGSRTRATLHPIAAGIVMLVLAYALALTVRPYAISGRDTRVHLAAVVGAAIVLGGLIGIAQDLARGRRWRPVVLGGLSLWLGLMLGFGLVVQNDYVRAWSLQKEFWRAVVVLVPDLQDGTTIVIDPAALRDTRHIAANYWNLPRVLEQTFQFPTEWVTPPRVYRLAEGWQDRIVGPNGRFVLNAETAFIPPSNYTEAVPGRMVLLEAGVDGIVRQDQVVIGGRRYDLQRKPSGPPATYPPGPLYGMLLEGATR